MCTGCVVGCCVPGRFGEGPMRSSIFMEGISANVETYGDGEARGEKGPGWCGLGD